MPCSAPARGTRQTPPHTGPAFNDVIDNNPCGRSVVTMVFTNVDVSAHTSCLPHLKAKLGDKAVGPPYTFI